MDVNRVREKYKEVITVLKEKGITVSAMESCTGGLVSSLLTDIPGASDAVKGGAVAYSNEAKIRFGVPEEIIALSGVYSPQCAAAMADSVSAFFGTEIGIGITGSLCTVDRNNSDSVPGTVYAAVKKGKGKILCICVSANDPERYLCKLTVADAVADMILDVCEADE